MQTHAQVQKGIKPEESTLTNSDSGTTVVKHKDSSSLPNNNKTGVSGILKIAVKVKDSIYVFSNDTLMMKVAANEWLPGRFDKRIPRAILLSTEDGNNGESNQENTPGYVDGFGQNNTQRDIIRTVTVKDSIYIIRNDTLVMRASVKDWPSNQIGNRNPQANSLEAVKE
jgi:hypothetical protein